MNDRELEKLFQQDLSAGTESFRDKLLARCLEVLEAGGSGARRGIRQEQADDESLRAAELDDDVLELLAAAGGLQVDGPDIGNRPNL